MAGGAAGGGPAAKAPGTGGSVDLSGIADGSLVKVSAGALVAAVAGTDFLAVPLQLQNLLAAPNQNIDLTPINGNTWKGFRIRGHIVTAAAADILLKVNGADVEYIRNVASNNAGVAAGPVSTSALKMIGSGVGDLLEIDLKIGEARTGQRRVIEGTIGHYNPGGDIINHVGITMLYDNSATNITGVTFAGAAAGQFAAGSWGRVEALVQP